MKGTNTVKKLMVLLVSAFCLITWGGLSEAWAKGPVGKSGVSSRVITPPMNTGASNDVQARKAGKKSPAPSVSEITITKPFDKSSPGL